MTAMHIILYNLKVRVKYIFQIRQVMESVYICESIVVEHGLENDCCTYFKLDK